MGLSLGSLHRWIGRCSASAQPLFLLCITILLSGPSTVEKCSAGMNSINCFSCASEEYEILYERSPSIYSFGQPMQFDRSCDSSFDLENFAPVIRCDSTCITVIEPQFFGGVLNEKKPYTFIRGCATDIFSLHAGNVDLSAESDSAYRYKSAPASYRRESDRYFGPFSHPAHPAEIDYLHRAELCTLLPIQELWPELFTSSAAGANSPEFVQVCSCLTDACNRQDAMSGGRRELPILLPYLIAILSAILALTPGALYKEC